MSKPIAMFCNLDDNWAKDRLYEVFSTEAMETLEQRLTLIDDLTSFEQLDSRKEELQGVEFLFSSWGAPEFTDQQVKTYFPALKAYFYGAGSVQYFARPLLENQVRVFSAARANAVPVAEMCLAQIILANKGFYQNTRMYSADQHDNAREYFKGLPGNYDVRIGLIGCGMIAQDLIQRLNAFRYEIVVYDPYLADKRAEALGVTKVSLEELFETSQVISNHLPNNDETKGMLSYDLFSRMGSHATFLNTGRGAQVHEDDLVRALQEVPTRTAVLDVTWPEPVEPGHEFFSMENVFLSTHIAGSAGNELRRMGMDMVEECIAFLDDKPLHNEVTLDMLATMA